MENVHQPPAWLVTSSCAINLFLCGPWWVPLFTPSPVPSWQSRLFQTHLLPSLGDLPRFHGLSDLCLHAVHPLHQARGPILLAQHAPRTKAMLGPGCQVQLAMPLCSADCLLSR